MAETITINGSKLYRDLWVRIGKGEQFEMEGRFGFPKDQVTELQLKIIYALAYGDGITVTPEGVVTPVGEINLKDYEDEDDDDAG